LTVWKVVVERITLVEFKMNDGAGNVLERKITFSAVSAEQSFTISSMAAKPIYLSKMEGV